MEGAALAIDLAGCRAQLERERAELAAARARLQEQGVSAAAWEETKKQAAARKGKQCYQHSVIFSGAISVKSLIFEFLRGQQVQVHKARSQQSVRQ